MPLKRKHDPGYKLPEVIEPEQNCCICVPIPNDFNHKMAFLGQLDELGYWWNWERDDLKQGREAAAVWREIVACIREELNMSDCGCGDNQPTNTRINPTTGLYEVSYDGGTTWQPDPGSDPRSSGTIFPPLPGDPGTETKCAGSNSVVGFLQELQVQEYEALVANANIADIITGLIGALSGIGLIFAFVPAAIAALLAFVVNKFAHMIAADFNAEFTEATWDELACILYCHIEEDGSFTEAGWQAVKSKAISTIGDYAGYWIHDHINLIGTVGFTNAARAGYPGTRDCESCGCGDNCVADWTLQTGTYVGEFLGFRRYSAVVVGDRWSLELVSSGVNDCCVISAWTSVPPAQPGLLPFHINCGSPQTFPNLQSGWVLETCYNFISMNSGAGGNPFTIDILMTECS